MPSQLRSTALVPVLFVASIAAPMAQEAGAPHPPPPADFLAQAARALGAPASEVAVGAVEGPVRLRDAGLELFVASAEASDGRAAVVTLDARGVAVDLALALELDRALAFEARGKVSARLADEVLAHSPGERHLAVAWIEAPAIGELREVAAAEIAALDGAGMLTHERGDEISADLSAAIAARIGPATEAFAAELAGSGFEVAGRDEYAPIVFVRGSAVELARLARDPRVESLDFAGTEYAERLNVALGEVRANTVHAMAGGGTGVGAKVSIVESGRVCSSNPYMVVSATKNAAGGVSSHTTGVGSCVKSSHATYKGIAPGCTLISANGADFVSNSTNVTSQMPGSVSAISWSVTQGAHIMNLSYGAGAPGSTVSSFDKYLDWVARNNGKTICVASGNSGNFAGDPGAGYNQIAVGAFDDRGSSAWSGEFMASFSSWNNPSTGLETPQVAAPGVNITMLTCASPWTGYTASGTSFSSPITAGAAALVVGRQPALGGWPEGVRAILMATAWHNIEGAAALSSRDGAGGIDALAAYRVAARGKGIGYNYGTVTSASFDGSGLYTAQTAAATAGQTVRVCLSFDSTPSAGPTYSPDTLKANLNLRVYAPGGALVASSSSTLNSFEMVQFTAPTTGTYTVRILRTSFTGTSEYWGTAFSVSSDQ